MPSPRSATWACWPHWRIRTCYVAPTVSILEEMGRDTGDMHPSMERARLIALGYWGQLAPLLGAVCAGEDPVLASAVRNIVNHWLPAREHPRARNRISSRWPKRSPKSCTRNSCRRRHEHC